MGRSTSSSSSSSRNLDGNGRPTTSPASPVESVDTHSHGGADTYYLVGSATGGLDLGLNDSQEADHDTAELVATKLNW